jgi:hypothetical protein
MQRQRLPAAMMTSQDELLTCEDDLLSLSPSRNGNRRPQRFIRSRVLLPQTVHAQYFAFLSQKKTR